MREKFHLRMRMLDMWAEKGFWCWYYRDVQEDRSGVALRWSGVREEAQPSPYRWSPEQWYSYVCRGQGHSLVIFTELTMDCEWLRCLRKQRGPRLTLSQSPPLSTEPVREPTLLASKATVTEHKDAVVLTCLKWHWHLHPVVLQWPESAAHGEDEAVPGQQHPHHR